MSNPKLDEMIAELVNSELQRDCPFTTHYLNEFNQWYTLLSRWQKMKYSIGLLKYTPPQTNITIKIPKLYNQY